MASPTSNPSAHPGTRPVGGIGQATHYLLVPDRGAARRLRRLLAEQRAGFGVLVGVFPELVDHARRAYLLPRVESTWKEALERALGEIEDGFWSKSFQVAPVETLGQIGEALRALLGGAGPDWPRIPPGGEGLPPRARRHLSELVGLQHALGDTLPEDLASIRALIDSRGVRPLRPIIVYHTMDRPPLDRWQQALVARLNADAEESREDVLEHLQGRVLNPPPRAARGTLLGNLQVGLFSPEHEAVQLDETVQWLGVRDYREECEVAAGMARELLDARPGLTRSDLGILMPDDPGYRRAAADAFDVVGLPLAGLAQAAPLGDIGREAVFHFLVCRHNPAPTMALAALLSSPLMPWSLEVGALLAQRLMDGDYRLEPPQDAGPSGHTVLALIRETDDSPAAVSAALSRFVELLRADDQLALHRSRAHETAKTVCQALSVSTHVDWRALRRLASPETLQRDSETVFGLDAISILDERHEPWRCIRHLIVLGFCAGRYPTSPRDSCVFSHDDIRVIVERLSLDLDTPERELARCRGRFRRQLSAASDSVTFLLPRRDALGNALAPSASLVFMRRRVERGSGDESLVCNLDEEVGRARARHLAIALARAPARPRTPRSRDLRFGSDLLRLRLDDAGEPRPQSPTSLETLMVSPMAWLLRALGAEPRAWDIDRLDALTRGSLAHAVFEQLFAPERVLPATDALPRLVGELLDDAARRTAPFLRGAQWRVERQQLERELLQAAGAWKRVLEDLGLRVLATEEWLEGRLEEVPIHGKADAIVRRPDGGLLIVDYKKSTGTRQLERMERGYDSQASLYRIMLAGRSARAGIVYYMMNDQRSLADRALEGGEAAPGWHPVDGDVSAHALALIKRRLGEVKSGRIRLNRAADEAFFKKTAGMIPYALDDSPLIRLFMIDEAEATSG